ncbi:hypothetical protein MMC2321_03498 [Chitinophaga sp. MM2321]
MTVNGISICLFFLPMLRFLVIDCSIYNLKLGRETDDNGNYKSADKFNWH